MYITTWPIWNTYAHNTGKIYDSFAIMQDRCACCHIPLVWVEEGPLVQEVDEGPLVQEGPSPSAVTSVIKNTIDTVNVHVLCCKCIVGASLSKPHIDRDNSPHSRNNAIYLSIYLCIMYPAFVAPRFTRSVYAQKCSVYSGILTCSRAWFTTALDRTRLELLVSRLCREDYRRRQVGECADTWYKPRIQPTETVEL